MELCLVVDKGLCVSKVASLDDVKHNSQVESNAAKQTALDHLGVIAAKIRTAILKFQSGTDDTVKKALFPLEEVSCRTLWRLPSLKFIIQIVSNCSLKRLNRFLDAHHDVASLLCKRSSEDQAYDVSSITLHSEGYHLSPFLERTRTNCCDPWTRTLLCVETSARMDGASRNG